MKNKKILVLGSTGFLGKQVTKLVKTKKNYKIFSITRGEGTDIRKYAQLKKKLSEIKPDAIINAAGHVGNVHYVTKNAANVINDNIQMALNLYRVVSEVCPKAKIINPFGNCSYPGEADIQKESEWQNGAVHDSVLAFGFVKRTQYAIAESYRKQHGIKSVNWIVCNPYGPEDHINLNKMHALNGIMIRMMEAKKKGDEEFEIWGTGKPIREWLYIEDAAKILFHSIDNVDEQTHPVNVAQKRGYSIAQIAKIVAKQLNYPVKFVFNTKYQDGAPIKIMDNKLFKNKYPKFKFTPLEEGIKTTIKHFQKILK